jgi:hypothetical protein
LLCCMVGCLQFRRHCLIYLSLLKT